MSRMSVVFVVAVIALVCVHPVRAQRPLQLTMDANSIWIRADESPILQYRYGEVPFKPYVKELYSPGGVNVLLDAPADHLHHHGLMFAVSADGTNFWEETPTAGRQVQVGSVTVDVPRNFNGPSLWDAKSARFSADVHWVAGRRASLIERRTIEVCRKSTPGTSVMATVLAWRSELNNGNQTQPVALTGSHYFGFGLRFPRSMDASAEFLNAEAEEGMIFRGEERLVRSNWCACRATAADRPVTVAMFGHPDNPREPATWFTMAKPFAYMSATLALHEQTLEISPQYPLTLRYCVVIWDQHILPAQIDAFYKEWASNIRLKLKVVRWCHSRQRSEPS